MAGLAVLRIPKSLVERLSREAQSRGIGIGEYLLDLLLATADAREKARAYAEAARDYLDAAGSRVEEEPCEAAGDALRAAVLAVRAHALWREGGDPRVWRSLEAYVSRLASELGEWIYDSWMAATSMRTYIYDGLCAREHVEHACKKIRGLVERLTSEVLEAETERPGES